MQDDRADRAGRTFLARWIGGEMLMHGGMSRTAFATIDQSNQMLDDPSTA